MAPTSLATIETKAKQARQLLFCDRTAKHLKYPQHYFKPQAIAGYIGFLGHQNLGDEVLFEAFKLLFPELQLLTYDGAVDPVHNPPFCYYPAELALYKRLIKPEPFYNIVFLGGGTLINRKQYLSRLQHALRKGNQCIVLGTGVADPAFWQEHDGSEDFLNQIQDWVALLQEAAIVKVRGPRSAQILASHGLDKPEVISDPALAICQPRSLAYTRTGTIGINVGSHGVLWGKESQAYETIVELIRHLIVLGWRVDLLPFHRGDLELSHRIAQQIDAPQVSIWPHYNQIQRTLQHIKTYDLLIGQRLHSTVLACGCAVPFISLKYAPKCDDFLESIGLQSYALRTDELSLEALLSLVNQIEQTYDRYCQQLIDIGNYYRMVQHQLAQKVVDLLL